ncbi:MAG: hypothetical protein IRZ32_07740 [Solirubrobacteraceae bacterium]|nr:hypothetical protein [Solirubrobacteraceae bacterium]
MQSATARTIVNTACSCSSSDASPAGSPSSIATNSSGGNEPSPTWMTTKSTPQTTATAAARVEAGLGVALVPRLAQAQPPDGVVVRPLAGDPPCRHLFAACRRGAEAAPAVRALLDALREAAGDREPALAASRAEAAGSVRSCGPGRSSPPRRARPSPPLPPPPSRRPLPA